MSMKVLTKIEGQGCVTETLIALHLHFKSFQPGQHSANRDVRTKKKKGRKKESE